MRKEVSRRTLLKSGIALAGAALLPETFSQSVTAYHHVRATGAKEPLKKKNLEKDSVILGVAPHENDSSTLENSDSFALINIFKSWYSGWGERTLRELSDSGFQTMLSIRIEPQQNDRRKMKQFVQDQKNDIQRKLRNLKTVKNLHIRFNYEMNAPWFPHGTKNNTPQEFSEVWKWFFRLVKDEIPDAKVVWCGNTGYNLHDYIPDDEYTDIVSLDGYNKYSKLQHSLRHYLYPNESAAQVFKNDIRILQDISTKPIMIAEIGTAQGLDSGPWLTAGLEEIQYWERVMGVVLFCWDKGQNWFDHAEADWSDVIKGENAKYLENYLKTNEIYTRNKKTS